MPMNREDGFVGVFCMTQKKLRNSVNFSNGRNHREQYAAFHRRMYGKMINT